MSIGSIGSNPFSSTSLASQLQQFRSGKTSISKDDLEAAKSAFAAAGQSTTGVDNLIDSFSKIDTNNDGSINSSELKTYEGAQGGGRAHHHHRGPKEMTKDDLSAMEQSISQNGGSTDGLDQIIQNFDSADANKDGKLSFDEMKTYADANGISLPGPKSATASAASGSAQQGSETSLSPDTATGSSTASASGSTELIQLLLQRYAAGASSYTSANTPGLTTSVEA